MLRKPNTPLLSAPPLLGALFLCTLLSSCKPKPTETPDWPDSPPETSEPSPPETALLPPKPSSQEAVRFLSYNLRNYLTMRRGKEEAPKPEREIQALISLITTENPDLLGLSEIGTPADLADLQSRLKQAGLDLPHSEHTGGADETRHLALLSRYPISARNSQRDLTYELDGNTFGIRRGILDATIDAPTRPLRILGVHFKSKREIEEADQALIRLNEAHLLREHADFILDKYPKTNLLVFGDFNDTINSAPLKTARGTPKSSNYLHDFYFKDSRGELWTHFWNYQDVYSRFDYVLYNNQMRNLIDAESSYIVEHPQAHIASDHRALMIVVR